MNPKEYGEYLRKLRQTAGLTQEEVERRLGSSGGYLSAVENGRKGIPRPTTLEKLAAIYGVPIQQLLQAAGVRFSQAGVEERLARLSPTDRKTIEDLIDFLLWRAGRQKD